MFVLHSSNKSENLLAHLAAVIQAQPLSSPFLEEVFLIQSQGMERWLSQQLASEFKVWGNFRFLFPGRFFATIAENLDSSLSDEAFDRHLMLWHIEATLRNLQGDAYQPLRHYLNGENSNLKRFQLAQELAQIFDQYQVMRSDMLALWQRGDYLYGSDSEKWQCALWHQLTAEIGGQHRGELWLRMIDRFVSAEIGEFSSQLPERVSVFGVHSLPPLFLSFMQGLGRHCDVHFFLLNPAQAYWADAPGKKLRAHLETFDCHPLLATLGQQGREFQQMLLEQVHFELELDSFEENPAANNLQQLQNDLLANRRPVSPLLSDGSISVHACHSRMREVQVVKNQLLAALEKNPDLQLRDIVVMAPDIQMYAPFISAVFDDVQHAIADRSLRLGNSSLDVFISFLHVSRSRFGWQSVLDLLEQPAIYCSFDLSESDLELIRFWIEDTRVRWGRSADHKQQLGLPPQPENTWQAALERLLMGYAVGDDNEFVDGILPYPHIEGSSAVPLGGLHDFLQMLFQAAEELSQPKTLKQWGTTLYRYADLLLAKAEAAERQQLNELLLELGERCAEVHDEDLSLDVMIAWLEGRVSERKSSTGFLRGQLTFCSMLPMRSIPFRVIALLGLNDGEFPKIEHHPTFDLLGNNFRPGDRSRRADDRYQFLEILLSARHQLIITYIGQSLQHNDVIPPSVIVSELLDVLADDYHLDNLVVRHPLQAFSVRHFDASDDRLFSYVETDRDTAANLHADKEAPPAWWQGEIAADAEEIIDLSELFAFYRHPQKYFMQRQMGLAFQGLTIAAEEREPFALEGLENYLLQEEWISAELRGDELPLARLQAQGRWPAAAPGEMLFACKSSEIRSFADKIKDKRLGELQPDRVIDIAFDAFRLVGKLSHLYRYGSLLYRYSPLKGKDFMQAWLHHLLINLEVQHQTHLLSNDRDLVFSPDLCRREDLKTLIDIFRQGRRRPDAFFTEVVFDYVQQTCKVEASTRTHTDPLLFAINNLQKRLEQPYEVELRQLFSNPDALVNIFDQNFIERCRTLVQPVWEAVNGG